jgi:diguanylate cyclase
MTKILVIEDTKSLLEEIIETLSLEGFDVKGAENGAEGVQVAKQYLPDLIVCDVMMPELDGYQTLEALQNYPPTATTPFIFLTAKSDRADMRHGMELGADDFLTKPFASSELLGAIAAQLKKTQILEAQYNTSIQSVIEQHQSIQDLKIQNDPLTNLPNWTTFDRHLQEAIIYSHAHHCFLALILIDIDNFNIVNNSLGHRIGDILLKAIAERLRRYASPCDPLIRMQGGQFALITIDRFEPENLNQSAQKILELLAKPYNIFGHEVFITVCLGLTLYPQDHYEVATLINNVDMALYSAKAQGRNNYKFYSSNLNTQLSERMAIENSLHRAFERKEFRLYYQPIFSGLSQEIKGIQALIRWQHPDLGIVLPDRFMPLAETTGLITPLTEWIVEQACKQLKIWQELLKPKSPEPKSLEMYIAVNLSAHTCNDHSQNYLVELIRNAVKTADILYSQLELEITEIAVSQSSTTTITDLATLRQLGIKIAIADFNGGHTALNLLQHFPADKIKIHKSLIHDLFLGQGSAIALAIINQAHSLNLSVVAESVETREQFEFLHQHNCELMQGYFFSPPLPTEQFTQLLLKM